MLLILSEAHMIIFQTILTNFIKYNLCVHIGNQDEKYEKSIFGLDILEIICGSINKASDPKVHWCFQVASSKINHSFLTICSKPNANSLQ